MPNRSDIRIASTCHTEWLSPISGRAIAATPYPKRISGFRFPIRSDSHPAGSRSSDDTVSAEPSITPSIAVEAPSTDERKSGMSG